MFVVTGSQAATGLGRDALWQGLLRKSEDPVPFVRAISGCRVLRRHPDGFEREIVLRGEPVRERVRLRPQESVRFERLSGTASGWIENRIVESADGGLALCFTFALEVAGCPPGSDAERAWADRMAASYLEAVRTTLERIRGLVR